MATETTTPPLHDPQPPSGGAEPATGAGSIEERLRFETLLADLATRFVHPPAHRIDPEIESALERIAAVLGIDRCSVAQFDEERTQLRVTHAFAAPGVAPMPDLVLNEQLPWYTERLLRNEPLVMNRVAELPDAASVEKAHCAAHGIRSSVLIPLAVGGAFRGVVGFAALRAERRWPAALVRRLTLLATVFANALERKASEQKLQAAFEEIQGLTERLEAENRILRRKMHLQDDRGEIVWRSEAMGRVLGRADQVAGTDTTVMLLGETGTGKEIVAQRIHGRSRRRTRAMVTVNCAALPSELVESELFGHERGAFTGAGATRIGRFELADGSTLFLDEIGELPTRLQAKLLRVLQTGQFERLGGHRTLTTDARVLAASNRDLLQAVRAGDFRMDLFYRLNVFPIVIPPLRERPEDIPPLVRHFLRHFAEKTGKRIDTVPRSTMRVLQNHGWPGNVRELRNLVERSVIVSTGRTLQVDPPWGPASLPPEGRTLDQAQKAHILETLHLTGWRVRGEGGAAQRLALKPTTLESKMARLGIRRPPGR
jgi:transcriptional regulator with GAF, ATPase, and Fis domain